MLSDELRSVLFADENGAFAVLSDRLLCHIVIDSDNFKTIIFKCFFKEVKLIAALKKHLAVSYVDVLFLLVTLKDVEVNLRCFVVLKQSVLPHAENVFRIENKSVVFKHPAVLV